MKKHIISTLIVLVLFISPVFVPQQALASDLTIRDLINLLIILEVIPANKIEAVNAFLAAIDDKNTSPVPVKVPTTEMPPKPFYNSYPYYETPTFTPTKSNISLEQKLRGPATHSKAVKDCKDEGMRLPNWKEAISTNVNPSEYLTEYLSDYVKGVGKMKDEERLWTGTFCGYEGNEDYEGYDAYSTSWRGLPEAVINGTDILAQYDYNNCTVSTNKHYYQCVADDHNSSNDSNDNEDENDDDSSNATSTSSHSQASSTEDH